MTKLMQVKSVPDTGLPRCTKSAWLVPLGNVYQNVVISPALLLVSLVFHSTKNLHTARSWRTYESVINYQVNPYPD